MLLRLYFLSCVHPWVAQEDNCPVAGQLVHSKSVIADGKGLHDLLQSLHECVPAGVGDNGWLRRRIPASVRPDTPA
jgi:hypothetical protein